MTFPITRGACGSSSTTTTRERLPMTPETVSQPEILWTLIGVLGLLISLHLAWRVTVFLAAAKADEEILIGILRETIIAQEILVKEILTVYLCAVFTLFGLYQMTRPP